LSLAAGVVLTLLQWDMRSEFSLFGKAYRLDITNGKVEGGISTAWLMLLTAVGGVLAALLIKLLFKSIWHLRAAMRVNAVTAAAQAAEQARVEPNQAQSNDTGESA
jgi:hypothetical protein